MAGFHALRPDWYAPARSRHQLTDLRTAPDEEKNAKFDFLDFFFSLSFTHSLTHSPSFTLSLSFSLSLSLLVHTKRRNQEIGLQFAAREVDHRDHERATATSVPCDSTKPSCCCRLRSRICECLSLKVLPVYTHQSERPMCREYSAESSLAHIQRLRLTACVFCFDKQTYARASVPLISARTCDGRFGECHLDNNFQFIHMLSFSSTYHQRRGGG